MQIRNKYVFSTNSSFNYADSSEEPRWFAIWGNSIRLGTLAECLDVVGIYGIARQHHMNEACETGRTGKYLWKIAWLSE